MVRDTQRRGRGGRRAYLPHAAVIVLPREHRHPVVQHQGHVVEVADDLRCAPEGIADVEDPLEALIVWRDVHQGIAGEHLFQLHRERRQPAAPAATAVVADQEPSLQQVAFQALPLCLGEIERVVRGHVQERTLEEFRIRQLNRFADPLAPHAQRLAELIAELGQRRGIGIPLVGELDLADGHGINQLLFLGLLRHQRRTGGLLPGLGSLGFRRTREKLAETRRSPDRRRDDGQQYHPPHDGPDRHLGIS